ETARGSARGSEDSTPGGLRRNPGRSPAVRREPDGLAQSSRPAENIRPCEPAGLPRRRHTWPVASTDRRRWGGTAVEYGKLILIFTSIIYEALPFIVLGVILAGLLEEFVPQQFIARLIPRRRSMHVGAIAVGGVLGLIFPMCECGIIVVM